MKKKGNIFFGFMVALIIWIAGILMLPFIVDDLSTFRVDMDCSNSSISNASKITCLTGDAVIPYFIWTLASLALGFIVGIKS